MRAPITNNATEERVVNRREAPTLMTSYPIFYVIQIIYIFQFFVFFCLFLSLLLFLI